jgi:hypothetical protein
MNARRDTLNCLFNIDPCFFASGFKAFDSFQTAVAVDKTNKN